jgi:hypothetical protein
MMYHITVDYSERDRERRFKILEGANWDLEKARKLLQWVDVGDVPRLIVRVPNDTRRQGQETGHHVP